MIKGKKLISDSNTSGLTNNFDLDNAITILVTKVELKAKQDKLVKCQVFDSNYFRGKSHFEDDDTQNCSVFQPIY